MPQVPSHRSKASSRQPSPLESISEDASTSSGDPLSPLPAPAFAYASASKQMHSSSPSKQSRKTQSHKAKLENLNLTEEERMAMLMEWRSQREDAEDFVNEKKKEPGVAEPNDSFKVLKWMSGKFGRGQEKHREIGSGESDIVGTSER